MTRIATEARGMLKLQPAFRFCVFCGVSVPSVVFNLRKLRFFLAEAEERLRIEVLP